MAIDSSIFQSTLDHYLHELQQIRTGRASPSILEDLKAEYYGTMTPVKELASISAPEPMMLVLQVWDAQAVQGIEKAIRGSTLGLNPAVEGQLIRVPFPSLTAERRDELAKVAKQKAEGAKISVRSIREEHLKDVRQREQDGTLSEDQAEIERKDLQKAVDAVNALIHAQLEQKQKEIQTL